MNLLDRYLAAVRQSMFLIPAAERDDIVRELEEDLRAQIDEKEEQLGTSLTAEETDAILQRSGHPLLVAGRYRRRTEAFSFGPQWIGPELFPLYKWILVINLSLTGIAVVVVNLAVKGTLGLSGIVPHLALHVAIVTAIFMAVEASIRRSVKRGWSMLAIREPADENFIPRSTSVTEIIVTLVFAHLWLNLPWRSVSLRIEQSQEWSAGPLWSHFHHTFFVPVLLVMGISIAISLANLIDPYYSAAKLRIGAAANVAFAAMIVATFLLNSTTVAGQLAVLRSGAWRTERLATSMNVTVLCFLSLLAIGALCQGIYELVKAARVSAPGLSTEGTSQ